MKMCGDAVLPSWSKAIDIFNSKLTKDEKKIIDLTCQRVSFSDLLSAATTARDKAEERRFPWTARLQRIFSQINRFAPAGDLIVQHHPEYTSLVWGSFRFLLLVGGLLLVRSVLMLTKIDCCRRRNDISTTF